LRVWMEKNEGVADLVSTLVFRGADLVLSSEKGSLPDVKSKSYPLLKEIKYELASKGVFRHADMFAFGDKLLKDFPALQGLLSRRFPLVLIDEMQDTSWEQEELLGRIFDESVVVQRFGDVNQQILSSTKESENLTFPREGFLKISSSKRFGPAIAKAVSAVQLKGNPVVGEQRDTHPPTLILYVEKRVDEVIQYFGGLVLGAFSDEQLKSNDVRALCSRKQGGSRAAPGRHLGDYWPSFEQHLQTSTARSDRLWALLADGQASVLGNGTLAARAGDSRRAVLLALRAAGSHHVADVRDGPQLLRSLDRAGLPVAPVRRLCRDLTVSRGLAGTAERRAQLPVMMYGPLRYLLPSGMTPEQFAKLMVFAEPELPTDAEESTRTCIVEDSGRRVEIKIGTVASMKGETHLASLVLESHGGLSKRFDLAEAIPILAGARAIDRKASDLLKGQFRNLYVAMSRPTDLLCLAANKNRVAQEDVEKLTAQGWKVHVLG
jgi:DNA helicase II / ATP-dependent DNA helicase PcrA